MKDLILLLGRREDPHIRGIAKELQRMKEKFVLIDRFSRNDSFIVKFDGSSSSLIKMGRHVIKTDEIKSVWNYSALQINVGKSIVKQARDFVLAEWTEGIASLWRTIPAKWVNDPLATENAANRLGQLQLAAKLGLNVPKTLVTNDPKSFQDFYAECRGSMIAKTLHSSVGVPEGKMIFTTRMTERDLKRAEDLRHAPCMFQEYVPKTTEFRVTIVGENLHVAEIFSQRSRKTRDDWRRYDNFKKTPYVQSQLPNEVSKKLLKLMREMKLEYGAADLIKTPSDDFVFLEVNPNGRWWWVQELTGMDITKSIAKHLSQR
ncbi:MAG TPA: hypothetical protein VF172_13750 [Nitrososphaera sp.]